MNITIEEICRLYYRYRRTSNETIVDALAKIKLVRMQGAQYHLLSTGSMTKIIANPRLNSLTFDAAELKQEPIDGLKKWKDIEYLVKCNSRFFLKPDIGEVFDAIEYTDLRDDKLKAICINEGHLLLPNTDGEHFIMTVTLLS